MRILLVAACLPVLLTAFTEAGTIADGFRLPDVRDEIQSSDKQTMVDVAQGDSELTVVCFLGTECPLAKLYAPRLNELASEFSSVRFLGVNSNVQDSAEDVSAYAAKHKLTFPMLKDFRNEVADQFDAKRTPEVFVLDSSLAVRYRGRIDNQYTPGVSRKSPTRNELHDVLQQLLAGEKLGVQSTEPVGCIIGRVKEPVVSSDITYCKQVSRILQNNCVECHRSGEIGPFQLEDYDEVVGWAEMIVEVVDDGRMPPWHATPDHGDFVNARFMAPKDKATLRKWVEAGMPYGDGHDLPTPVKYTEGWRLDRTPDQIVAMNDRAFEVPEDGTVEYQYFVVDPGFKEDKWITGAQIIPGNSAVVHHSIAFVRPPDGSRFRGIGWLTAYVPGARVGSFPKGSAMFVPAGSKFVFQQHYTPNGTAQSDITKLGITFGNKADVTHEIYTIVGIDQEFEIPPNAANHKVSAQVNYLPRGTELLSINPHMHVRGKQFEVFIEEDGQRRQLLDVPNYDFNWQHTYRLRQPIPVGKIDKLEFDATFDNSEANPVNPDPTEYVSWGDQTWEEMAVCFFEVREPIEGAETASPEITESKKATREANSKLATMFENSADTKRQRRIEAEVDRILGFDKNKDGVVSKSESPFAFRRWFWRIDKDNNQKLSRSEIEKVARERVN